MILRAQKGDLEKCLLVIRESFATVAEEFGLTEANCPGHTAFLTPERLARDFGFGNPMYLCERDGRAVGFVSLRARDDDSCEMKLLSVLPPFRHLGIGRELVEHAKRTASVALKKRRMTIGIMDESAVLKDWYISLGFVETGARRFAHLPFTVGFLEMPLQ